MIIRKVALYYTADLFSLCRQVLHCLLIFVGKYFDCCHCKVSASRWELAASCCSFYIGSINRSSDHAALSILACYECKLALIPMQKHNAPVCARTLSPLQMFKTWLTCCLNLCSEALQRGMTQACSMLSYAPSQLSMQSWQSGGDSLGSYSPVHQLMFQAQLSLHLVCVLWAQAGWTHSVREYASVSWYLPLPCILPYISECAQSPLVVLTSSKALFTNVSLSWQLLGEYRKRMF